MNVCKCKLIFPSDTLQQKIEITDLKPFLAADNTSVLIILATAVLAAAVVCVSPVVQVYEVLQAELPCVLGQVDGVHVLQRQTQSCETDTETQTR